MSLSNLQNSLFSSRRFLWNLRNRLKSDGSSQSHKATPKNFTFDHDSIENYKPHKSSFSKWLLLTPLLIFLGTMGFLVLTVGTMILFFLHGVKMLWEGHGSKKHHKVKRVQLKVPTRCKKFVLKTFRKRMVQRQV